MGGFAGGLGVGRDTGRRLPGTSNLFCFSFFLLSLFPMLLLLSHFYSSRCCSC